MREWQGTNKHALVATGPGAGLAAEPLWLGPGGVDVRRRECSLRRHTSPGMHNKHIE